MENVNAKYVSQKSEQNQMEARVRVHAAAAGHLRGRFVGQRGRQVDIYTELHTRRRRENTQFCFNS